MPMTPTTQISLHSRRHPEQAPLTASRAETSVAGGDGELVATLSKIVSAGVDNDGSLQHN